jgi:GntR family transcriptional regulator/MocR family aminotransferase
MPIQWAGLSPTLLLPLARGGGTPLRTQLERGLREAIRSGQLAPGERLPSSRQLAASLGVSRGLVQESYGQLLAEGYLTSRGGSATRVADRATFPSPTAAGTEWANVAPDPTTVDGQRLAVDFRSGVPDLASFPRGDWAWACREVCRDVPNAGLDYGDPAGDRQVRDIVAGYQRRVRGAVAGPAEVLVCNGFAQGLALVLRALSASGVRRVAFEDPGYSDTATLAATAPGLEAVPVPVDAEGIDVDALATSGAQAVVLTPAHQWPTGVVLTPARRHALIDWADQTGALLIEDDYDAEFRYDREPVGTLQGLAPDRVALIGTVSKSLAPAVRLGWIVCPRQWMPAVVEEKRRDDRGSSGLDQLVLALLLQSGRYDRHLRRMRTLYARRRAALLGALARHAPPARVTGLAAGFHAVLHLPDGAGEADVISAARERSVGLYGMSTWRADGATTPPQLVLGFGNLDERAIATGIATVADLLRSGRDRDD